MMNLYSFLSNASNISDFKAELCNRGGYLTFSNSGRRGDVKYFQIGLDNILQTLNDILNHLDVFHKLTSYDETEWRNNGSNYFTDPVAKANSTVQTKPLFSTLSKIILWGNQPNYSDVDTDKNIILNEESLKNTINKLEIVANCFSPQLKSNNNSSSMQVIYYGAPGTGKSHSIDEIVSKDNSIRTTFHPDSDYASFVGCYKPVAKKDNVNKIYSQEYLCAKLKELQKDETYPCQKFGAIYWESLEEINTGDIKDIIRICEFPDSMYNEVTKGIAVGKKLSKQSYGFNITYDFVPQAFTKAYIEAWKDRSNPYYLLIEEINRGNCAQIFGDLFQLLDRREDGFSSYEIAPDTDLQQYLAKEFVDVDIEDEKIKEGKSMRLPSNLYILATMNTSDQSLFPIDSAFKRRWDWKYIPIKNEGKNHKIVIGEATYDWWNFIEIVNKRIEDVTDSEDKQIGYWFAKANDKNEISADTLVSKVIFYLWNDVFKDYAHSTSSLFHTEKRKYKFREFYLENGDVNINLLNQFLLELGLKDETPQSEETQSTEE